MNAILQTRAQVDGMPVFISILLFFNALRQLKYGIVGPHCHSKL